MRHTPEAAVNSRTTIDEARALDRAATKRARSIAFLRSLRACDAGVTIYQDTIDDVLAEVGRLADAVESMSAVVDAARDVVDGRYDGRTCRMCDHDFAVCEREPACPAGKLRSALSRLSPPATDATPAAEGDAEGRVP